HVHRAQRTLGARGRGAVLPPPHAALPHAPRRAADGTRPAERARPDRVLARATRTGARAMKIGVPTEIKADECRVAITPAAEPELAKGLQRSGAICIAYETVEDAAGRLPLLAPMSEVAGKIATQAGAFMLEKPMGGRGILLGGVPGVAAATVLVIGGGVVGMNAAVIAIGMQADVFVFDKSIDRLRELEVAFAGRASTVYSSTLAIE